MKKFLVFLAAIGMLAGTAPAQTITYQGRLGNSGSAANGVYDFEFELFDAASGTNQVGVTDTVDDVNVVDGLFTVELDFSSGSPINYAQDLWLEINAKEDATPTFGAPLAPRVQIRANPLSVTTLGIQGVPVSPTAPQDGEALLFNSISGAYEPTAITATSPDLGNFNQVVFVNPDTTQSGTPAGSLDDPFDNLNDAYAYALTQATGSFFDRTVVYLMPGVHDVSSTVVMSNVSVDIIGFGSETAMIRGTADPLVRIDATNSGPRLMNLQLRPETGGTNVALEVLTSGRVQDVTIGRGGGSQDLVTINLGAGETFSLNNFELIGNMTVTSYGAQTTITEGYISGSATVTGSSTTSEFISFAELSTIGSLDFQPAGIFGILALTDIPFIAGINYSSNTIMRATNVSFLDATTLVPLTLGTDVQAGSVLTNTICNPTGWTGTTGSTGNVAGQYISYLAK